MLSRNDIVDHQLSWSIYLLDPDRNRFESRHPSFRQPGSSEALRQSVEVLQLAERKMTTPSLIGHIR